MQKLLQMNGISKSFPGVQALQDVDFDLNRGEVHALVGENGAGKSTLMKILSGVYTPDQGEILLKEQPIVATRPRTMLDAGVSVIYQELNLVPHLSVAENVLLGREPLTRARTIDWRAMRKEVGSLIQQFNVKLDPRALVYSISPAYQQVVEIIKAISLRSEILVMDEPTASLTGNEVGRLFEIIRNLKSKGVSIIYISHRLEELWEVADRVTVLRDGERIVTRPLAELDVSEIIRSMVGREMTEQYPAADIEKRDELLRVENLSRAGMCSDVSFSVRGGEILGFSGLVGAGRTEIMQLVFGSLKKDSGRIFIKGKEVKIRSTRDAVRHGIALIPEERKRQGLVLDLSVFDNTTLAVLDRHSRYGFLNLPKLAEVVKRIIDSIGVRTPSPRQLVRFLSGGNQQKVVLSKWFIRDCDIYIFDEPTRGIDVGAKVEIYRLMQTLAKRGAAVIMVSSELLEVLNMSDRLAVVFEGRLVKEFERGEATEEKVMHYALGVADREAS
ncbi:MAG: sugar ABC transporter ATP-binding protein [Spirochaetaceae bacterium]|nr:MAG: sugar ABC transporter ATP-binding protein [Spirochaetaceae bacterium]